MRVEDIMTKNPIIINEDMSIIDATSLMLENNIDGIPVVDNHDILVGLFTKGDLYYSVMNDIDTTTRVKDIMKKEISYLKKEDNTDEIFKLNVGRLPVIDDDKKVIGIVTTKDLLKEYHNRNSYINEELNTIFTAIHNGIMLVDSKGKIKNINKSAKEILKRESLNDINNLPFEEVVREVLNKRKDSIGNSFNIRGKNIIINVTPFMKEEVIEGVIVELNDITTLQDALKELNTEKNLTGILRTILDNAYDGIVVIDKDKKITMINNSYAKFLGVDKDEVIGEIVTDVIENTRLHIILKTGQSEIGEIQKIGSKNIVAMRVPIREGNNVVGAMGKIMFRDVQEVKSLASKLSDVERELQYYKSELIKERQAKYSFENIPSESKKMNDVKSLALKASRSNSTILIIGESGTGKELFAHSIHNASPRHMKPFVKMNCAAIPADLLESELFGYEEGAFTGSRKGGKVGKFKLADGGTIFLDEIGDMPLNMQAKILRVLQEKEVEPIGSNTTLKIDARVIAATNRNLTKMVNEGKFRKDLYYRLNVIKLEVPSLRERKEDLEILIDILFQKHRNDVGKFIPGISKEAIKILKGYHWPGNVRELENAVERAINLVESGEEIKPINLPQYIKGGEKVNFDNTFSLKNAVEEAERNTIIDCLKFTDGNRAKAAKILNISRSTLYEKLDRYDITKS
ncbi:sigma 54-interacting transcriptional regulator [Clostridium sp. D2Q-11]|uniref:Sigma 54-interacting transcriptional regulator n=1 Tax=Anaeromonas frigoriresistens TaxID=2683708 RepID=A0A942Z8A4_9FIRM|nr:sigma-54-dependent Fis family transcriptional regulator [Anaeromonas frigoriresistens]MBS4538088.1 sigma 54-interacting transcriptional regulator [Anaeromonas frigoriresistens]